MLQEWEEAVNAIDSGLQVDQNNTDFLNGCMIGVARQGDQVGQSTFGGGFIENVSIVHDRIRKARLARQKRERIRAERVAKVKQVWQHCSKQQQTGRQGDQVGQSTIGGIRIG